MPGYLLNTGAKLMCPHGGQVSITPGSPRVKVASQPAAMQADTYLVSGCSFMVGNKPQPCVTVQWTTAATRVSAGGTPVLEDSVGICQSADQIPAGPPRVVLNQIRVKGT